jgi:hypothetical protein
MTVSVVLADLRETFQRALTKMSGSTSCSYSYVDPKAVKKFVKDHPDLTPLAKREGQQPKICFLGFD